jgi:L-threonine kinase
VATASIPLTCGELVQGLYEGEPALVSCPIDSYSHAQVRLNAAGPWQFPAKASKAVAALEAGCRRLRYAGGGVLELESSPRRGRGFGTSSADIASCLYAFGDELGAELTPDIIAEIAVSIEPSDSTIFPGLTFFDHRSGSYHQTWGAAPPLNVILLDPGGRVDTIRFNQLDHQDKLLKQASIHQEAFNLLRLGLQSSDWQALGQAASLSAKAHQAILDNPLLEKAFQLAAQIGALGVCRAHSGTILGLIIDPNSENLFEASSYVAGQLPASVNISCHRMVDGGPRFQVQRSGENYVTARTAIENPTPG